MAKKRIHQIAKELDIASADVLHKAKELGFEVKTASSGLTPEDEELLVLAINEESTTSEEPQEQNNKEQEFFDKTVEVYNLASESMSDLNKQKDIWISQMNNSGIQAFRDHIFEYMINRQYELVPHHEVKPVLLSSGSGGGGGGGGGGGAGDLDLGGDDAGGARGSGAGNHVEDDGRRCDRGLHQTA